jgi:hypothetical protein
MRIVAMFRSVDASGLSYDQCRILQLKIDDESCRECYVYHSDYIFSLREIDVENLQLPPELIVTSFEINYVIGVVANVIRTESFRAWRACTLSESSKSETFIFQE